MDNNSRTIVIGGGLIGIATAWELVARGEPVTVIEAREDAMVKKMLDGGPFAFVVLGGGHDLSDNIERLGGGSCEYLTVETKMYSQLSGMAEE